MYNYHGLFTFSDREIEQLCTLMKRWSAGDTYRPIDARTYTSQVKEWGCAFRLLEKRAGRIYLTGSCAGLQVRSLPIEVLWRLVSPLLNQEGSTGYSIVNNPLWMKHLALAPATHRFATIGEQEEKEAILGLLASHQYIYFQSAGSVWSIYRRKAD